jgi:thymidylate synthase (FAD)
MTEPEWLKDHRALRQYRLGEVTAPNPIYSRWPQGRYNFASNKLLPDIGSNKLLADVGFNSHELNDGRHVSPFDNGRVQVGVDGLKVRLLQGVDEASFARVLSRALRATTGISLDEPVADIHGDQDEMLRGGLQSALETQTIVFEVTGASRALTHQLVRTRKAGFHQQSQRATWYGDRPEFRMPHSVFTQFGARPADGKDSFGMEPSVRILWDRALLAAWEAYKAACDAGVSYQDARYILPEGITNYILCEYTIREFINVFAYRGCSMFLWEMVHCMREMRRVLLEAHPFLEPHVKISCEKSGSECGSCHGSGWLHTDGVPATTEEIEDFRANGDDSKYQLEACSMCEGRGSIGRKCTFQGWENVEGVCSFPWARQDNRVFLPNPRNRIGG